MDTIFMDFKNSETADPYKLLINFKDKKNFKRSDKYVALSHLSMYYKWENIKNSYKNNKFKRSAPTWNEEFESTDESYSASDTQFTQTYL